MPYVSQTIYNGRNHQRRTVKRASIEPLFCPIEYRGQIEVSRMCVKGRMVYIYRKLSNPEWWTTIWEDITRYVYIPTLREE